MRLSSAVHQEGREQGNKALRAMGMAAFAATSSTTRSAPVGAMTTATLIRPRYAHAVINAPLGCFRGIGWMMRKGVGEL